MLRLKEVISAIQSELHEALQEAARPARPVRLEAERILLSLELHLQETSGPGDQIRPHVGNLTIEFKPAYAEPSEPLSGAVARDPHPLQESLPLEGAEADRIAESLSTILGQPGFDSSARATVFREALSELSELQARAVIQSLTGTPLVDANDLTTRARFFLANVLKSGPLKSPEKGAEILERLLSQYTVASLLHLINSRWMTQQDWLDKPIPRPKPEA